MKLARMININGIRKKIILALFILAVFPFLVSADYQGQKTNFFIDSSYDINGREAVRAVLENVSQNAYFYLEDEWYANLTEKEKEETDQSLLALSKEFDENIYPRLTSIYGLEWKPGIDNNSHIIILFHQMKKGSAGYFRNIDEYSTYHFPSSNEKEMIYMNADYINYSTEKSFLAHEFTHLITFNQKDRINNVSEDVWLNESRADYSPTFLNYDDEYQESNLQQRVRTFVENHSDSLTEWQGRVSDYGMVNVFTQYLVDNYGINILKDSLHSEKTGISSINYALSKNGFEKDFFQVFTDWTIAIFLNDCKFGKNYCYKNENLKNLRVSPSLIFLPSTQKTSISLNYSIKEWSGNWYKIIGGEGELKVMFDGYDKVNFTIPYILCGENQKCEINFFDLDEKQSGEIIFPDFSNEYTSLVLIPSIQSKISDFNDKEQSYPFSISVFTKVKTENEKLIEKLNIQIAQLKIQIAQIQAQISKILMKSVPCHYFEVNLQYNSKGEEVVFLQKFLKAQGPEIYPQGLTTGFFGKLTRQAVIRFQEKYAPEILEPFGLEKGTGFVGLKTREKINKLLSEL